MPKQVSYSNKSNSGLRLRRRWVIGFIALIAVAGIAFALQMSISKSKIFSVPATMADLQFTPLGNDISSSYKLSGPTIVNDFKATAKAGELEYMSFTMVTRMKGGAFKYVSAHLDRTVDRDESIRTIVKSTKQWSSFDESVSASRLFTKLDQLQTWVKGHSHDYTIIVHTQKQLFALEADYYQLTDDGVVSLQEPLTIPSFAAVIHEPTGESQAVVYIEEY